MFLGPFFSILHDMSSPIVYVITIALVVLVGYNSELSPRNGYPLAGRTILQEQLMVPISPRKLPAPRNYP